MDSTTHKIGNKTFKLASNVIPEAVPYIPSDDAVRNFIDDGWRATVNAGPLKFEMGIEDLADDIVNAGTQPIWCWGHLGTGKSQAVIRIAAGLKWPLVKFVNNADKTEEDIVGSYVLRNGETVWIDQAMVIAMNIGAIFLVEEPSHGSMLKPIHAAAEMGSFTITRTGVTVVPHPNFRVVAVDNELNGNDATGRYASTRAVDSATRSRFQITYHVDYPEIEAEKKIIALHTSDADAIEKITQFAQESRILFNRYEAGAEDGTGISSPVAISTRMMIGWAKQYALTGNMDKAFAKTVLSSVGDSDATVCAELYQRIAGTMALNELARKL